MELKINFSLKGMCIQWRKSKFMYGLLILTCFLLCCAFKLIWYFECKQVANYFLILDITASLLFCSKVHKKLCWKISIQDLSITNNNNKLIHALPCSWKLFSETELIFQEYNNVEWDYYFCTKFNSFQYKIG